MHKRRSEPLATTPTRPRSLSSRIRHPMIIGAITLLWLTPILLAVTWIHTRTSHVPASTSIASGTSSLATEIARQSQTTPARYDFTAPIGSSAGIPLVGDFALYYAAHHGSVLLGAPLAPAYPITGGWVQFFASGALALPSGQGPGAAGALAFGNPAQPAFAAGVRDPLTGIIRLPLTLPLLRAGSLVAVAGAGTPSYAELRRNVILIALAPVYGHRPPTSITGDSEPLFIYQQAEQSGTGQIIPQSIWQFINRADIAPDGWQTDIGLPLTLPVSMTLNASDGVHQLQVQCFMHAALVEDDGVQGAASMPVVSPLPTGLAYLQTLGAPAASTTATRQAWVTDDAAVLDAPGNGQQRAQLGLNFPVTLTGGTRWIGNDLWYAIHWTNRRAQGNGWLDADALSFSPPAAGAPVWSSFDTLSPDLADYLRGLGGDTGAVVYDESRHHYYTYNMNGEFTVASSMKVPFLLAFLTMTESQGREPDGDEMYLLQTMIENSDNDSAQALFLEMGGLGPAQALLGQLGISGFEPNYDAWGWSTITPLAMVRLLTALHDGTVLTAQDRALALSLMAQIESDQQTGVGSTAPQGASYWMKDGWVPAPNGLWAMNSSGIVTLGGETYMIAVYSQNQASLDDGQAIAAHVCGAVGQLLTA